MSNRVSFDLTSVPEEWSIIPCGVFFKEKSIKNTEGEVNLSVYRDYGVIKSRLYISYSIRNISFSLFFF